MKSSLRRKVGRGGMVAALAALLPLVFAVPAQASDSVDTSVVLSPWVGFVQNQRYLAQTFTANHGGQVDRVSLPVSTPGGFAMFTVSLYNVDTASGQPSTLIGSAPMKIGAVACCGFNSYFSPALDVKAGNRYAIVVYAFFGNVMWMDSGTTIPYLSGTEWRGGPGGTWLPTGHGDFGFEEFLLSSGPVNQAPVVTADRAPVNVPEGTTATNTGACSDTDGDTVSLTASSGTVTQCVGGHWSWSLPTTDDGPARTIIITASDGHGNSTPVNFQLNVTNVAPTAAISWTAGLVITTLENLDFHAKITDADSNDTYTTKWDFGDRSTATGTDPSHAYTVAGTYTVTFTVDDNEGGVVKATTTVDVKSTQDALSALETYVQGLPGLNDGQKHSLITKLSNAADAAARGDNNAASNELNAFLNELQAYVDAGKVSPAAGTALRAAVNAVRTSLGSFNRLVEWWPLEA